MTDRHAPARYLVRWEMHFDAEGPEDAVRQAVATLGDPHNTATFYSVTDVETGQRVMVDAEENR